MKVNITHNLDQDGEIINGTRRYIKVIHRKVVIIEEKQYKNIGSCDQGETKDTGGSRLSHTVVKPDSRLARIFCIISFLYNLINLMQISTDKPDN